MNNKELTAVEEAKRDTEYGLEMNAMRSVMGTLPIQKAPLITMFHRGVEGITAELVDGPVNPYKAMYIMATSCWGDRVDKWEDTTPEHRFLVVKAVMEHKALPLALEAPKFTFVVEGPSRAAFDQIARTRVGAVFSAKGMRDNNWSAAGVRIPTALFDGDPKIMAQVIDSILLAKKTYHAIVEQGKGSWQAARTVLPLYVCYGWTASYNLAALMGVCRNRMKFCEMEDTVATAWLMAKEVTRVFPLLGSYLRPGCDFSGKCQYHQSYALSEAFGCLFKECGRNPVDKCTMGYAEFNQTCTNKNDLEEQLDIVIPGPKDWPNYNYSTLEPSDRALFNDDGKYGC